MLPLLLMLVLDQLAPSAPVPPSNPESRPGVIDGQTVTRCDGDWYQRVDQPAGDAAGSRSAMTYRPDGEVRRYLLLDRTIRGCAAPISFAVPDAQGGVIRDLGAPLVRPPIRPPSDVQPPRSSE